MQMESSEDYVRKEKYFIMCGKKDKTKEGITAFLSYLTTCYGLRR